MYLGKPTIQFWILIKRILNWDCQWITDYAHLFYNKPWSFISLCYLRDIENVYAIPPFSLTVSTTIGRGAGCSSTLEAGYNKVSGIITNIRLSWQNPDRFLNASWNPIHGHTEIGTQIPSPSYLQSGIDLATQAVYLYGGITIILYKTKQFVKKPSVFLLSRRKWEEIDTSPVGLVHDLQVSVLNRTKSPGAIDGEMMCLITAWFPLLGGLSESLHTVRTRGLISFDDK